MDNKFYLQQLRKEILNYNFNITNDNNINLENIFGLFGDDNTFLLVEQKSNNNFHFLTLILGLWMLGFPVCSKGYYLLDYITKNNISDEYDSYFKDNDCYNYNNINYVLVLLSKLIPTKYLDNISKNDLIYIQDLINQILLDNPDIVQSMFKEDQKIKTLGQI